MPEQVINVIASLLVCMPRIEKSLGGAIYQAVKVPITVGSSHKPATSSGYNPKVIYHYCRVKLQAGSDRYHITFGPCYDPASILSLSGQVSTWQ